MNKVYEKTNDGLDKQDVNVVINVVNAINVVNGVAKTKKTDCFNLNIYLGVRMLKAHSKL